jgi:glycosyltransferase involved in cell wall biosynthesis
MLKVSVIIPVFNAEKYLKQCIDSLLHQTLQELEFIFVNDGSTDASQSIIESYQQKDARICLINQVNQGVSVARNNGITRAQGDYIGFVDADDYVKGDMYAQLYSSAVQNNVDVVVSSFYKESEGVFASIQLPFETDTVYDLSFIKNKIVPYLIEKDSLNTSCPKLYRKAMLEQNAIFFPKGVSLGEDGWFNFRVYNVAKNVFFTSYKGYYYREVAGSATRNLNTKDYFKRALEVYQTDYQTIANIEFSSTEIARLKGKRLINQALSILSVYQNPENKIPFFQRFRYCKKVVNNEQVKFLIRNYWGQMVEDKNKFQKFILYCIKNSLFLPLWLALSYSNYRNK